jgi:hypothetical protein
MDSGHPAYANRESVTWSPDSRARAFGCKHHLCPAAVYYCQSSEDQIDTVMRSLQTIDMIEHLLQQGWERKYLHMIDMDAAVIGTKKICDRSGAALLRVLARPQR